MVLKLSTFVFKRISKDLVSLAILFVTPLVLITILGFVADDSFNELLGVPQKDVVALSMIVAFQLFSGYYTLELMKYDLLKERKWRMKSLPINISYYMFSIIIVTILYGGLQSFVLTHYTRILYGVVWGKQLRLIASIIVISTMMQVMYLNISIFIKSSKAMDRVATSIGIGSMLLGGVWFQLPDITILNFIGTYLNPYSLSVNVLLDVMKYQWTFQGSVSLIVLLLVSISLLVASIIKGRKVFK